MTKPRMVGLIVGLALVTTAATGCGATEGEPTAASEASSTPTTASEATSAPPTSESAPAEPTGQPIGTATMKVSGSGPATVRYRINGGYEQTEANVPLPWEKEYLVYPELDTSVSADGGDMCTIIMDGNLVAFKTEQSPTCTFAYWG